MLAQVLFQRNSEVSTTASISSKWCHHHITTRAMDRSKPALNSLKHTIKKCLDHGGDIHMALLQIWTTPLGQGLPSLATLLFNCLVHGVMPVIDRKPVSADNDDEHLVKLLHRQSKNDKNNDASQVFVSIPIWSTVAVQWEDRGLWSHGTIVGKGSHNHHSQSYNHTSHKYRRIIHVTDNTSSQHP